MKADIRHCSICMLNSMLMEMELFHASDDLQKKELAKNYATVAASQKNKMENTPKNDKEAEDSFNGALANELLSQDSEKAATAQKNIDEISSKIQEQIMGELR